MDQERRRSVRIQVQADRDRFNAVNEGVSKDTERLNWIETLRRAQELMNATRIRRLSIELKTRINLSTRCQDDSRAFRLTAALSGLIIIAFLAAVHVAPVVAQDMRTAYEAGIEANKRGDYAQAFEIFLALAQQGYTDAQESLGFMYDFGLGVRKDDSEAIKWYSLAGEQGHAEAQSRLGFKYLHGQGVPQNALEAERWYRLAAENGNIFALFWLGNIYYEGLGVEQDYSKAALWYRQAAEGDLPSGQSMLGFMYFHGQGVQQSYVEAVRLYRSAAEQGDDVAQLRLGAAYYGGKGVPQDHIYALAWFTISAANDNRKAIELRDMIRENFTSEEIAQAEALSLKIWEHIGSPE